MNKLAMLDFKRKKKSWRLLMSVMILAYTLIAIVSIFYASQDKMEEVQREVTYGSWHVALIGTDEETMKSLQNHATMEMAGISRTYGMVLDSKDDDLAEIGTVDENTIKMENIKLLEGRFPKNKGEVAIEMSSLAALGYLPSVNQNIKAKIRVKSQNEIEEVEQEFFLVGIIQDYSVNLKGTTPDKRDYVSFFVSSDDNITGYQHTGNIICRLKEEFRDTYQELWKVRENNGKKLTNDYTYFDMSKESGYQWSLQMLERRSQLVFIMIALSLAICITAVKYLQSQDKNNLLIHKIGLEQKELKKIIYKEIVFINVMAAIIGCLLGVILSYILLGKLLKVFIYFKMPIMLIILLEVSLCLLSSAFIGFGLWIYNITLIKKIYVKLLIHRNRIKHKSNNKSIKNSISKKLTNATIGKYFVFIVVFYLIFYSIYNVSYKRNDYTFLGENEFADFSYGVLFSYYPPRFGIKEDVYNQIKKSYGICDIEAFKSVNYLPIFSEKLINNQYVDMLKDNYWSKYAKDNSAHGFVLGIKSRGESFDYFESQLDKGAIDKTKFDAGEGVILYLPNYYLDETGNIELAKKGDKKETRIEVGDILQIQNGDSKVNVEVEGIIYGFDNTNWRGKLGKPFVVLGSYKLCDLLSSNKAHDAYEFLTANLKDNINEKQAEMEFMQTTSKYTFANKRKSYQEYKVKEIEGYYLFGGLGIGCTMILIILSEEKRHFSKSKDLKRTRVFRELGVSKSRIYISNLKYELKFVIIGELFAVTATTLYQFIKYYAVTRYTKVTSDTMGVKAWGEVLVRIPWVNFLRIVIVIILFCTIESLLCTHKKLKDIKM
ncbi:MAG TPA: ABC transporter permease [Candidatus Pelethocola excrementipullorum]|nr:ABC transporter permease [Candidatus Pelethocola excrementipullorum]